MQRIDVPIGVSYYRYGMMTAFCLVIIGLSLSVGLSAWQYGFLLLLFVVLVWSDNQRLHLRHLVEPNFGDKASLWQCLVETPKGEQLWQAQLLSIRRAFGCVVLVFDVVEPIPRQMRWVVFRDMIDDDVYRRLLAKSAFN